MKGGRMEGGSEETWGSNPPPFDALQKCSISAFFFCTTAAIRVLSPFVYVAEISRVDKLHKHTRRFRAAPKTGTTQVISQKLSVTATETRLTASRFGKCQKQAAPVRNSSNQTQAVTR